jgi:hypothetical protein
MTIDDHDFRSSADMVREAAADDAQQAWADYQQERLLESEEAEAARWSHLMRRAAAERPPVWYEDKPGYDRRVFAVDGDEDRSQVEQMTDWLGDAS